MLYGIMRHFPRRSITVIAGLALAAAAGCTDEPKTSPTAADRRVDSQSAEAGPIEGDWMIRWLLADPESMNPLTSNDSASSTVQGPAHASLLSLHPETLEQYPFVASELPEISDDHLTYTFRIRDDVTFSDGRPLTVEDVLFTVKAIKIPEVDAPHVRNYWISVVDVTAVDDRTVKFACSEPYFRHHLVIGSLTPLPRHFYDPDGELEGITVAELEDWEGLSEEKKARARSFARQFNRDYHRKMLGAGGYVLDDLVTGERVVLKRRENYWAEGNPLLGFGWVDRMFFRVVNDRNAALVAMKAGELDVLGLTPLQHLKQTNTPGFEERFEKEEAYSPVYTYVGWNQERKIFQDLRVRRALGHFVDRDRIIDKVLFGLGEKVNSPIYKFRPEYHRDLDGVPFDPEKGRALLEDAGWEDRNGDGVLEKDVDGVATPLRFEIISNSGNQERKNVGLIVVDQMRRAGIDASFREVDWSILLEKVKTFDYDAVILGWLMSPTEPDLYQVWHSSQAVSGGSNHVAFRNEEADEILVEYRKTFDEKKRIELYRRLQEILDREAPYAFLYMPKGITAFDRRFRNTPWYPSGGPLFLEWWVPKAEQRYGGS